MVKGQKDRDKWNRALGRGGAQHAAPLQGNGLRLALESEFQGHLDLAGLQMVLLTMPIPLRVGEA